MGFADPTSFNDYMDDMKRQLDKAMSSGEIQFTKKMFKSFRQTHNIISEATGWPKEKVDLWFKVENPLLGYVKPAHMILLGRGHKLKKFVENQIDETRSDHATT